MPSVEHLKYHADVTYFSPVSKKIASAAATTVVAFPVTVAFAGRRWATAFTGGLICVQNGRVGRFSDHVFLRGEI